jgi:hypothetical protein
LNNSVSERVVRIYLSEQTTNCLPVLLSRNQIFIVMKEKIKNHFAVVTGASQGLGRAFALELAKRKYNLVLVSLPGQGLQQLSAQISRKYDVESHYYETNFSARRTSWHWEIGSTSIFMFPY